MSLFCPKCAGEFSDATKVCPHDLVALQKDKPKMQVVHYVDAYRCKNEIEAERIMAFLRDEGIDVKESTSHVSQIPSVSDEVVVSVRKEHMAVAVKKIAAAIEDGVIGATGEFI